MAKTVTQKRRMARGSAGSVPDVITVRGGRPLRGEVTVRGAKNGVSKELIAALLTDEPCTLRSVPDIEDVGIVSQLIETVGGTVSRDGDGVVTVRAARLKNIDHRIAKAFSCRSRVPILFAGPLLIRLGEVFLPRLGGCEIGSRPVDFHLTALEQLGATVRETAEGFSLRAEKLRGAKIRLPYPSVGATEQVLLASACAEGVTELSNAAIEPEILDLIAVLQKMGAIIFVHTDRRMTIMGVPRLGGYDHTAIVDRIEVASWASAAAVTGGEIFVRNARQLELMAFLNAFRQVGGAFTVREDGILFARGPHLASVALETDVHPGFMTDWQQPFTVLLTQAEGASIVHETVYENRFGYVKALNAMGAKIQLYRECLGGTQCRFGAQNHLHSAVVTGPTPLHGADITVPDLRAGFSYVVAALAAKGKSTIRNMRVIRRGYENLFEKLEALGADIKRA